jgi:hypothetical protein
MIACLNDGTVSLKKILLSVFILFFINKVSLSQEYSKLWGQHGELWNKSKIPDFTNAGYKEGAQTPDFKVSTNVKDFGAKGDGTTDDTRAIKTAIAACKKNSSVLLPEGIYLITDTIVIKQNGICIKGADKNKTILKFTKGLEELYPHYDKPWPKQTDWSWSGAMILFEGNTDVGIENVTIEFPDSLYGGHNWYERGYNGIGFSEKAHDGWVKNILFKGCDVGIWVEKSAHHITADNWVLQFGAIRAAQKISGHHGVTLYGGHCMFQNFIIIGKYVHDVSVESEESVYNVIRNGKGTDLCIDHHNHEQRNNLFTNLDAGLGTRIYFSGGVETPRGISFNETYWNITATSNMKYINQWNNETMQSANNVCVGIKTILPSNFNDKDNNWFETINPANLYPKDLYEAQIKLKAKKTKRKKTVK